MCIEEKVSLTIKDDLDKKNKYFSGITYINDSLTTKQDTYIKNIDLDFELTMSWISWAKKSSAAVPAISVWLFAQYLACHT